MKSIVQRENGVIAIFFATVIALLLFTTTTYAARVTVSELNQSSQVDRSEAAYYAAEAGVEQAIRTIDNAGADDTIQQMFPEQFSSTTEQPGDTYNLTDDAGQSFASDNASIDDNSVSRGQLSWRHRRVYAQSVSSFGTQVKDQSMQIDTTLLQRRCAGAAIIDDSNAGTSDCIGGGSLHSHYKGIQYCWTPNTGGTQIELSVVRYPDGNPSNVITEKYLTTGTSPNGGSTFTVDSTAASLHAYSYCFDYNVDPSYRYIFRMKPVVGGVGAPSPLNASQNGVSVKYRFSLVETTPTTSLNQKMFMPNDSFLIDVTGESGDIHRRIVARKLRNGQLLGIFDFALYSGDPGKDLCKVGVSQTDVTYNPFDCSSDAVTNVNQVLPVDSVEGETMVATAGAHNSSDGTSVDATASNGALYTYSHSHTASVSANTIAFRSLTITARQDAYTATAANMVVTVDGVTVYSGPVAPTTLTDIDSTSGGPWATGNHTIAISFTNDGFGGVGLDRNLYVDLITFNP